MLNFNVLYTSFIPYTNCIGLSNLIYLPILVNIINVIKLCLIKEPFKEYYLFIYYLEYLFIYLIYLFTLPILVLISIITILMCLINHIHYGSQILLLSFYCVTEEQFPFLMWCFKWTIKSFESWRLRSCYHSENQIILFPSVSTSLPLCAGDFVLLAPSSICVHFPLFVCWWLCITGSIFNMCPPPCFCMLVTLYYWLHPQYVSTSLSLCDFVLLAPSSICVHFPAFVCWWLCITGSIFNMCPLHCLCMLVTLYYWLHPQYVSTSLSLCAGDFVLLAPSSICVHLPAFVCWWLCITGSILNMCPLPCLCVLVTLYYWFHPQCVSTSLPLCAGDFVLLAPSSMCVHFPAFVCWWLCITGSIFNMCPLPCLCVLVTLYYWLHPQYVSTSLPLCAGDFVLLVPSSMCVHFPAFVCWWLCITGSILNVCPLPCLCVLVTLYYWLHPQCVSTSLPLCAGDFVLLAPSSICVHFPAFVCWWLCITGSILNVCPLPCLCVLVTLYYWLHPQYVSTSLLLYAGDFVLLAPPSICVHFPAFNAGDLVLLVPSSICVHFPAFVWWWLCITGSILNMCPLPCLCVLVTLYYWFHPQYVSTSLPLCGDDFVLLAPSSICVHFPAFVCRWLCITGSILNVCPLPCLCVLVTLYYWLHPQYVSTSLLLYAGDFVLLAPPSICVHFPAFNAGDLVLLVPSSICVHFPAFVWWWLCITGSILNMCPLPCLCVLVTLYYWFHPQYVSTSLPLCGDDFVLLAPSSICVHFPAFVCWWLCITGSILNMCPLPCLCVVMTLYYWLHPQYVSTSLSLCAGDFVLLAPSSICVHFPLFVCWWLCITGSILNMCPLPSLCVVVTLYYWLHPQYVSTSLSLCAGDFVLLAPSSICVHFPLFVWWWLCITGSILNMCPLPSLCVLVTLYYWLHPQYVSTSLSLCAGDFVLLAPSSICVHFPLFVWWWLCITGSILNMCPLPSLCVLVTLYYWLHPQYVSTSLSLCGDDFVLLAPSSICVHFPLFVCWWLCITGSILNMCPLPSLCVVVTLYYWLHPQYVSTSLSLCAGDFVSLAPSSMCVHFPAFVCWWLCITGSILNMCPLPCLCVLMTLYYWLHPQYVSTSLSLCAGDFVLLAPSSICVHFPAFVCWWLCITGSILNMCPLPCLCVLVTLYYWLHPQYVSTSLSLCAGDFVLLAPSSICVHFPVFVCWWLCITGSILNMCPLPCLCVLVTLYYWLYPQYVSTSLPLCADDFVSLAPSSMCVHFPAFVCWWLCITGSILNMCPLPSLCVLVTLYYWLHPQYVSTSLPLCAGDFILLAPSSICVHFPVFVCWWLCITGSILNMCPLPCLCVLVTLYYWLHPQYVSTSLSLCAGDFVLLAPSSICVHFPAFVCWWLYITGSILNMCPLPCLCVLVTLYYWLHPQYVSTSLPLCAGDFVLLAPSSICVHFPAFVCWWLCITGSILNMCPLPCLCVLVTLYYWLHPQYVSTSLPLCAGDFVLLAPSSICVHFPAFVCWWLCITGSILNMCPLPCLCVLVTLYYWLHPQYVSTSLPLCAGDFVLLAPSSICVHFPVFVCWWLCITGSILNMCPLPCLCVLMTLYYWLHPQYVSTSLPLCAGDFVLLAPSSICVHFPAFVCWWLCITGSILNVCPLPCLCVLVTLYYRLHRLNFKGLQRLLDVSYNHGCDNGTLSNREVMDVF